MSRLAIQISVAAVFLTTVVSATLVPNYKCSKNGCSGANLVCVPTKDYTDNDLDICFDKPRPSGMKRNDTAVAQAYLVRCYEENNPDACPICCEKSLPGRKSGGEVIYNFCLCKLLK